MSLSKKRIVILGAGYAGISLATNIARYAKMINKSVRILIIPFLTPRLSSYWVDLVTPVKASLARPLIDSLKHEARVNDDSIHIMIPIQLKNFEESIKAAKKEVEKNKQVGHRNKRTSLICIL